ncbi:phosphoribosyltransferase [Mesorhizobium sp.]|uniref:phosphoribosyltransferase n=1 Tax=Mesorhizobium sp. TaxID=1871066 RepID=UPI000FE41F4E|nr:phosphoribosyltransferase [Mesorhizobium sp.]RWN56163.1 MAG: phosphoribosyltransferase [Mesorhizobium sp.]RWN76731.1 MAG: phosphoribosyltransferase [Mesorhizobium sp.]RWN81300.1 MAG: phosphoribosyltransferase [Mesorhizobium sp.]RWN90298.1 MAG: phosphoribosyltransferase [Mesorhizobium sp.]RWO15303.1 MAG: phosphoribosyltransferase [Mesorhizobium sp.]
MSFEPLRFKDRTDAGHQLAAAFARFAATDPLVLALPRGGVPVGFEVAKTLRARLDVMLVRKIGAPGHSEYGIGAVVDGENPQFVLNEEAMALVRPSDDYVEAEKRRQLLEIERRRNLYLGSRPAASVLGRTVIVVDDGIATGGTVRVALKALRKDRAAHVVLAVPVAPRDTLDLIKADADEVVCLATPEPFVAVSRYYEDFEQTTDAEVIRLLREAEQFESKSSTRPAEGARHG